MRLLIVPLLLAVSACPAPKTAPAADRPLEVHTCVAGSEVWVDGGLLPTPPLHVIADANGVAALPAIPAAADAFNVHAKARGYPEDGAVLHTKAGAGERIVVFLGSCNR